jgi:hypothetical protein
MKPEGDTMRYAIAGLALLVFPLTALAQPGASAVTSTTDAVTVSFVTGLSVGSDEVEPLAGGALSAGINPWRALALIEARWGSSISASVSGSKRGRGKMEGRKRE